LIIWCFGNYQYQVAYFKFEETEDMDDRCPFDDEQCKEALRESVERIGKLFVPGAEEWAMNSYASLYARITTAKENILAAFAKSDAPMLYKNIYIYEQSYKKIFKLYKDMQLIQKIPKNNPQILKSGKDV
jgi:hypothetical protein